MKSYRSRRFLNEKTYLNTISEAEKPQQCPVENNEKELQCMYKTKNTKICIRTNDCGTDIKLEMCKHLPNCNTTKDDDKSNCKNTTT